MTEYCIVSDDDGHDYVIPSGSESDWNAWVQMSTEYWGNANYTDAPVPELPKWAVEIGGCPSRVKFNGYRID